jgi:hypothetical protein
MKSLAHPNTMPDGFEWSEDFDGLQILQMCNGVNNKKIYYNFKCIVGNGGAQTRSLREVHRFVESQLNVLLRRTTLSDGGTAEDICFANILDGDVAHLHMNKFEHLCNRPEFAGVNKNRIYIGDLKGYFDWLKRLFAVNEV